jgi:hypothetical protein
LWKRNNLNDEGVQFPFNLLKGLHESTVTWPYIPCIVPSQFHSWISLFVFSVALQQATEKRPAGPPVDGGQHVTGDQGWVAVDSRGTQVLESHWTTASSRSLNCFSVTFRLPQLFLVNVENTTFWCFVAWEARRFVLLDIRCRNLLILDSLWDLTRPLDISITWKVEIASALLEMKWMIGWWKFTEMNIQYQLAFLRKYCDSSEIHFRKAQRTHKLNVKWWVSPSEMR